MYKQGAPGFKYFVGIESLAEVATREDRVCVLNIMGGESSEVTPVSHAFSGGNVVFGTSPGRWGQRLKTPVGDIPVFNNVRDGLNAGHGFNTGVIYLPPPAVRDGVAELVRVNPDLKKIVIITEKVSVHDSREIRALGQARGIDILGANGLGVADSWNRVRIGGALGGDNPGETLLKGSVAIFSNSGNFTTTIASYLATAGWGTTTLISSGKDVYIHFAAPEFVWALGNDDRSKAAVLYVEPGGYYEQELQPTKPMVACVVGRWKAKLTRAVGHAGAIAGSGDDAAAKERWFMEMFGVNDIFTPENPVCSAKGAVVSNISHIPQALTRVMALNGAEPDFAPRGDLSLKAWFGNSQGLDLPRELDLPVVTAPPPYSEQIAALRQQVGAIFPRQSMKDTSGASIMDPATQVTSLHGVSMLDAAREPLEANLCLAVLRELNGPNDNKLANVAIAAHVNLFGDPMLAAADAARAAGNAPNSVIAAAVSILGPRRVDGARRAVDRLVDLFVDKVQDATDESGLAVLPADGEGFLGPAPDPKAQAMLDALEARGTRSVFVRHLRRLQGGGGHVTADAVLAAVALTLAWGPLLRKRISRRTAINLPWYLALYGIILGASVEGAKHERESFCGVPNADLLREWTATGIAGLALTGGRPAPEQLFAIQVLLGLLLTNGPGTISAQGAKGAVAADGPETPERVQLNKAMVGFLTHSGFAHGGNGFEGMQFLLEQFGGENGIADPGQPQHGLDLTAMATAFTTAYKQEKAKRKEVAEGGRAIPGINHPVFRGKPVNTDPREAFVRKLMEERGESNVFHDYYHAVARALFDQGVTRNVFAVNIDAVIAAWLLKLLWQPYREGRLTAEQLETAAFSLFLYARMAGSGAEIEDHVNRGRNMDTRTAASACRFVS
jgi:succinyl-CoA synthetase alpha subunit